MEDISKIINCTCLEKNPELEFEDLQDADLCDPECPIHGGNVKLIRE